MKIITSDKKTTSDKTKIHLIKNQLTMINVRPSDKKRFHLMKNKYIEYKGESARIKTCCS